MDPRDIWSSAGTLIAMHGHDKALFEAAQRADAMNEKGDAAGMRARVHIMRAIEVLTIQRPDGVLLR